MKHVIATRAALRKLQALDNRLRGFPRKGRHVGGGRHAPISDTPGDGWTLRQYDLRKHPVRDEWAYPVDAKLAKLRTEKAAEMTSYEKGMVTGAVNNAVVLPVDWDDEPAPVTTIVR